MISGFTFVRNGIRLDYPFRESILSMLPLVDELIVAVGNSEDGTRRAIEQLNSFKIKIIDSVWDDSLREGGRVLAVETNKAMASITPKATWAIYLQADEVIHEQDYEAIRLAMHQYKDDPLVEGFLFNYIHFYGSYLYYGDSRKWYRREIRILRNDPAVTSWKDAQGFRKNGNKLKVKKVPASIFHYGWVKPPEKQQLKQRAFHRLWHDDSWLNKNVGEAKAFDYSQIDSIALYQGSHPEVMKQRIEQMNWSVSIDPGKKKLSLKNRFLMEVEKVTGWRVGEYRNYKII